MGFRKAKAPQGPMLKDGFGVRTKDKESIWAGRFYGGSGF